MAKGLLIESISEQAFLQLDQFKNKLVESMNVTDEWAKKLQGVKLNPSDLKTQFSETNTEVEKTKKIISDYERQVRKLENQQKKWMQSTNSINKAEQKLKEEVRLGNKYRKDEITLATNAARAYDRLQAKYNIAYRRLQDLTAAGKENTREFTRAQNVFAKYEARVTKADHAVKSFRRNVGNYPKTMGAATASLRNLMSAFGLFTGVFLFAQLMRNAANSVRLFDASMQNIAGIMRTSRDKIKDLEEVIISVAGSSVNTATQVAKLAEVLVTLGKTKDQIKDLLEPVNNLAIGLETTGADAAEFLVQTLNAFGASSKEAGKYADIIATIRTSTTLDFQKMRDSFQYLTPISRILNKDLAYTGAIIGVLADNGLKAEASGRLLGTAQQKLAKANIPLQKALDQINDAIASGTKETALLALASNLFGKQAAKVGIILAQNSGIIEENAQAIRDNSGALDDLVEQQLLSLDASLKILKSRWEEYILNTNEAGGASNKLSGFIRFLGDNLGSILNTIAAVTGAYLIYKTAMVVATIATRVQAAALVQTRIAAIAFSGGIRGATRAVRLFAASINMTPLGLLATAIGLIITGFILFNSTIKVTNKSLQESADKYQKTADKTNKLKTEVTDLAERYRLLKAQTEDNKDKSQELQTVMEALVKIVPQASKGFDEFGKTIGINTEEITRFVDELGEVDRLNKKIEIEKNTRFLAEQRAELKRLTAAEKARNGVYEETVVTYSKTGKATISTRKLTDREILSIKENILQTRKSVLATEDRIAALNGLKTSVELITEAEENRINKEKENTKIIPKLRAEIKGLQGDVKRLSSEGWNNLTEAQAEEILAARKSIKEKQAQIEAILGLEKATKKAEKAIIGTIDYYEQLIALEEKERDATATTADDYLEFEERISGLRQEIALLTGEYEKWLASLESNDLGTSFIKPINDVIVSIEDLDEVDLDFIDDEEVERLLKLAEGYKEVNKLVKQAFVNLGGTLGIQEQTINNLFDGIKDGFEDAGEAAVAFGALATDVINELARAQNARIDQQIERLGRERDIAVAFAGDSAEARAVIEDRYQDKVNALKTQQARNEQRAAIVSAIINTASAVIKTFAQLGWPAGIPAAAIISALGAAQVGVISSQPIPQFHTGVENFKGGKARINEYRNEVVTTPDGRVHRPKGRNLLVDLPQGTNVYSSEAVFNAELDKALKINGIDPIGARHLASPEIIASLGTGLDEAAMKRALIETLGSRPVMDLNINERGVTVMMHKQASRSRTLNNRINRKGLEV